MSATATRKSKPLVTDEEARAHVIEAAASLRAAQEMIVELGEQTPEGRDHDLLYELGRKQEPFHTLLGETAPVGRLGVLADRLEDLLRPPGYVTDESFPAYETEPLRVEIEAQRLEIGANLHEAFAEAQERARGRPWEPLRREAAEIRKTGMLP